jgi:hypothetical protein
MRSVSWRICSVVAVLLLLHPLHALGQGSDLALHPLHALGQGSDLALHPLHALGQGSDLALYPLHALGQGSDLALYPLHALGQGSDLSRGRALLFSQFPDHAAEGSQFALHQGGALSEELEALLGRLGQGADEAGQLGQLVGQLGEFAAEEELGQLAAQVGVVADAVEQLLEQVVDGHRAGVLPRAGESRRRTIG